MSRLARRVGRVALAFSIGLGWTAYAQHQAAIPLVRDAPYVAGPLYPGPPGTVFRAMDPVAQLRVLAADPSRIVSLPLRTLEAEIGTKAREVVGVLGQLDVPLPGWLYRIWCVALIAALVGDMLAGPVADGPHPLETLLILGVAVACVWGFYLALYLTWTPVGAERIEGVQGRYFLPVLMLLSLGVPRFRVARAPLLVGCCTALVAVAIMASVAALPALTVRAFY